MQQVLLGQLMENGIMSLMGRVVIGGEKKNLLAKMLQCNLQKITIIQTMQSGLLMKMQAKKQRKQLINGLNDFMQLTRTLKNILLLVTTAKIW